MGAYKKNLSKYYVPCLAGKKEGRKKKRSSLTVNSRASRELELLSGISCKNNV